jgi:hypothetical protein
MEIKHLETSKVEDLSITIPAEFVSKLGSDTVLVLDEDVPAVVLYPSGLDVNIGTLDYEIEEKVENEWLEASCMAGYLVTSLYFRTPVELIVKRLVDGGLCSPIEPTDYELAMKGDPDALKRCENGCIMILARIAAITTEHEIREDCNCAEVSWALHLIGPISKARNVDKLECLNTCLSMAQTILTTYEDVFWGVADLINALDRDNCCLAGYEEGLMKIVEKCKKEMFTACML